jgi:hypothetical protein
MLAVLILLVSACGGSADPEPPQSSTTSSNAISEADAVAVANAAVADQGLSADGLEVKPGLLFGEWQVSFEPADTDSLSGGFLVVLDAQTGELLDVVAYQ